MVSYFGEPADMTKMLAIVLILIVVEDGLVLDLIRLY